MWELQLLEAVLELRRCAGAFQRTETSALCYTLLLGSSVPTQQALSCRREELHHVAPAREDALSHLV